MMYQGKYESRSKRQPARRSAPIRGRWLAMSAAVILLLALAIGGTVAWLSTKSAPVVNTFTPSSVSCQVTEYFDRTTGVKTEVNVQNTGDIAAFVRVRLVTYRTNEAGQHIGGTAVIPAFTPGSGWVFHEGYYYYTSPVEPDASPAVPLIESMTLTCSYNDADGGRQAIDVMAEAIQSVPEDAVKAAWGAGFSIGTDGSLTVPNS